MVGQFFYYKELIDGLCPEGTGRNVLTIVEPEQETRAKATSLIGMPWGNNDRSAVYHTPADVLESVDPAAVACAIQLALDLSDDLERELAER